MSTNLDYMDMWHDLYNYLKGKVSKATGECQYDNVINIMEDMDPRLENRDEEQEES